MWSFLEDKSQAIAYKALELKYTKFVLRIAPYKAGSGGFRVAYHVGDEKIT